MPPSAPIRAVHLAHVKRDSHGSTRSPPRVYPDPRCITGCYTCAKITCKCHLSHKFSQVQGILGSREKSPSRSLGTTSTVSMNLCAFSATQKLKQIWSLYLLKAVLDPKTAQTISFLARFSIVHRPSLDFCVALTVFPSIDGEISTTDGQPC